MKFHYILFFLCCIYQISVGQANNRIKVHSHNDYRQAFPFWTAFLGGAASIEIDIFLKNKQLYVTHSEEDIKVDLTIEKTYLTPLSSILNSGFKSHNLQIILIDVKSEAYSTLDVLIDLLLEFPNITDNKKIKMVISGNRPKPSDYPNYPSFIWFDHQSREYVNHVKIAEKVAMVSLNFRDFVTWNGLDKIRESDQLIIREIAKEAHDANKPFRFWGTPDTDVSWSQLSNLGVDYINTDKPGACVNFFR